MSTILYVKAKSTLFKAIFMSKNCVFFSYPIDKREKWGYTISNIKNRCERRVTKQKLLQRAADGGIAVKSAWRMGFQGRTERVFSSVGFDGVRSRYHSRRI